MARFRCHWNLQSDGRTRSRPVDLPRNYVGKCSRLPLAIVDGPLHPHLMVSCSHWLSYLVQRRAICKPAPMALFRQSMDSFRVVFLLVISAPALSCQVRPQPAFVRLTESRRLVSEIRVNFAKAADASDRAVMADTDEDSIRFARDAAEAAEAVNADLSRLSAQLAGLQEGNHELLARFRERFSRYQDVDRQILELAVENTNLKAQRLSFGPVRQAADEFCTALDALAPPGSPDPGCRASQAVSRAQLAVREIQVLQAPHIAETRDAEMDRLEQQMSVRWAVAHDSLRSLEANARVRSRDPLAAASAALANLESLSHQLIKLSRKNSNVRSLQLALRQKPALTVACDECLAALQDALAKQGFSGTR